MTLDPKRFLEDPAMRLPTGEVVRLPRAPDLREFTLPGNAVTLGNGVTLAFDPTTQTLAMWSARTRCWNLYQPVDRAVFEAASTKAGPPPHAPPSRID